MKNPWTWPLVALIGVLVVVLAGVLIALFMTYGPTYSKQCVEGGGKMIGGTCYVPGYQKLH